MTPSPQIFQHSQEQNSLHSYHDQHQRLRPPHRNTNSRHTQHRKHTLTVIQINTRSLKRRLDELENFIRIHPADIIAVQESWLTDKHSHPHLPGFRWHGTNRVTKTHGGGVGFFISNKIEYRPTPAADISPIEATTISIHISRRQRLFLSSVYVPDKTPNSDIEKLRRLHLGSHILFGDFNAHHESWSLGVPTKRGDTLFDFCTRKSLSIFGLKNTPTLLNTRNTHSSPDLVIAGPLISALVRTPTTLDDVGSDHLPIRTTINARVRTSQNTRTTQIWLTDTLAVTPYKETLENNLAQWQQNHPADTFCPEQAYSDWCNVLQSATTQHCERKSRPLRSGVSWWKRGNIGDLVKQRARLRRRAQRHRNLQTAEAYNEICKQVENAKQKAQTTSRAAFAQSLTRENVHQKLRTQSPVSTLPDVVTDTAGTQHTSDSSIANALCEFFSTVADNLPPAPLPHGPPRAPLEHPALHSPITTEEVIAQSKKLKLKKAPGPDGIHTFMIKKGGPAVIDSLTYLFQNCWNAESFPPQWSTGKITPLMKTDTARTTDTFRPISLTPVPAKMFESIMNSRLQEISDLHQWVPENQAGFRKHRSAIEHLVELQQAGHTTFKHNKVLLTSFLDLSKAYDTVSRPLLLHKLEQKGVCGKMLSFLNHFLGARTSTVSYRHTTSNKLSFRHGVPQGSPLSPLIFNIYTAPAIQISHEHNKTALRALADDLTAWDSGKTISSAEKSLTNALEPVHSFSSTHRMKFSHGPPNTVPKPKSKVLTITRKRKVRKARVKFGPHNLQVCESAKYLGITFDRRLTFNLHVTNLWKEKVGVVEEFSKYTHTRHGCHQLVAIKMVNTIVVPQLEYGSEIWGDAPASALCKLDSILHKTIARALGVNRLSHRHDVCVEAGIPPLSVRRNIALLRFWIAIHKHNRPITETLNNLSEHDTLREQHRSSYIIRVHKLFTHLGISSEEAKQLTKHDLRSITNLLWQEDWDKARRERRQYGRTVHYLMLHNHSVNFTLPDSYSKIDRGTLSAWHGLRLHTAPLHEYLHSIECHPTPYCACQRQHESVDHYLLHCQRFSDQRKIMLATVRKFVPIDEPISKYFLLGNPNLLPSEDFDEIFRAVTTFIRASERFQ